MSHFQVLLNLSVPAAYNYFKERLSNFINMGVKGYKIDHGEEGEMPSGINPPNYRGSLLISYTL